MMMKHFLTAKMAFCKDSNLSHQTQISHHQRPLFLHQITTTHQGKKKNKQTQKSLHCRRREMGLDGTNQTKKDRFCLCLKDRYFDFYLKLFLKGCECVSLCLWKLFIVAYAKCGWMWPFTLYFVFFSNFFRLSGMAVVTFTLCC